MQNKAYISLGSNLGDKIKNLYDALDAMGSIAGIHIRKTSSMYLTEPWGVSEQEEFINQVVEIDCTLDAEGLLHRLQEIEIKMGRQRGKKWGARIIDLDILLYGNEVVDSAELKIPHPYIRERLFELVPLQEVNAETVFPEDGAKIREVLVRALTREGHKKIERIQDSPAVGSVALQKYL